MDNFDESDEKLSIEINLSQDVINSSHSQIQNSQRDASEAMENLLQNDNSKLVLQSKNPYSKLAFIKALKDNLICLGYLEETVDTLNYFHEDLINSTITSITSNVVSGKKRKILSRKRSHDKTNIIGERPSEILEVMLEKKIYYFICRGKKCVLK